MPDPFLKYDLHDKSSQAMDNKDTTVARDGSPLDAMESSEHIIPSVRLLFSFVPYKHLLLLVLPAVLMSIIAGGVAPFMTLVVGQAFDAFSRFPIAPNPPQSAKDALLRSVGIAALELIGLAVGSLSLSSVTSCLWIWVGEINAMALRQTVYRSVSRKKMAWFDTYSPVTNEADGTIGAGGLMAKFSRETDEVRMASSLASGMLVQYLTTCITCLILAFIRSWILTLVILSAVPILTLIQALSQSFAAPILAYEREQVGIAATVVERTFSAIATVKAFNAAQLEHSRATAIFHRIHRVGKKLTGIWAVTSGLSQFVMMAMFVQGFWFGGKLIREGKASAGDVMAVFWACLIATSNLQMCIPQFIVFTKGKTAMAGLFALIESGEPSMPSSPQSTKSLPKECNGCFALHNVTFAYPSRPDTPVLSDVSLFIPGNETTFIVGSSGSGKSTIAHLLLGMYTPQHGSIELDGQNVDSLDPSWIRRHVSCVGQQGAAGVVILEGKTIFENVAAAFFGYPDRRPSVNEVEEACRAALLHEFARSLPQGYDTVLGGGAGVGLSGGQKQRLAIARAWLRNPTVLILDEATSALDTTSRRLVFEALIQWRRNMTTVIITHDLSQIQPSDFAYVLKDGLVAEQGYRSDLEDISKAAYGKGIRGEFRKLVQGQSNAEEQHKSPPTDNPPVAEHEIQPVSPVSPTFLKRQRSYALRPLSVLGTWMFDDLDGLTMPLSATESRFSSQPLPTFATAGHSALTQPHIFPVVESQAAAHHVKRYSSYPSTPSSATFTYSSEMPLNVDYTQEDAQMLERSASQARQARVPKHRLSRHLDSEKATTRSEGYLANPPSATRPSFLSLSLATYSCVPTKCILFIGLIACVLSGAMTPIFSFLLSRLLFEVSIGAQDTTTINFFGGLILGIAAIDGLFLGLKYFIMETCAMSWVTRTRDVSLSHVLGQDKEWFDNPTNAPSSLVQILIKDAEDARDLIGVVWGQCCVVCAMLGVGLVWAFIIGWQLTLAGLAIAPVFAVVMSFQSKLVAKCELRNKRSREEVAREYYDTIINIRAIRSMGFDSVFRNQYEGSLEKSLTTGVRGAFVEGCTHGIASGLIYLSEALLFYVGAVLVAQGTYTYLRMVEVLDLVVFSVSIGSQLMAFTQKIAKSSQAACDLKSLTQLEVKSNESRGTLLPDIRGKIGFHQVSFSYAERRSIPVLQSVDLHISEGECVAIVGTSGCGKSTIASLLQRLYKPTHGSITIGGIDIQQIDLHHLRDHVSVVSQQPHLFDASISENIRYGHPSITDEDIRCAAKAANIHDFIFSLPRGYRTKLGENASLISGGQAQRLQIARALARPTSILILDECTSSLDSENRAAVLQTIREAKDGRTTIMITHDVEAMRICDRILVLQDGKIVEEGNYSHLMSRKGIFATLAIGGEWANQS